MPPVNGQQPIPQAVLSTLLDGACPSPVDRFSTEVQINFRRMSVDQPPPQQSGLGEFCQGVREVCSSAGEHICKLGNSFKMKHVLYGAAALMVTGFSLWGAAAWLAMGAGAVGSSSIDLGDAGHNSLTSPTPTTSSTTKATTTTAEGTTTTTSQPTTTTAEGITTTTAQPTTPTASTKALPERTRREVWIILNNHSDEDIAVRFSYKDSSDKGHTQYSGYIKPKSFAQFTLPAGSRDVSVIPIHATHTINNLDISVREIDAKWGICLDFKNDTLSVNTSGATEALCSQNPPPTKFHNSPSV